MQINNNNNDLNDINNGLNGLNDDNNDLNDSNDYNNGLNDLNDNNNDSNDLNDNKNDSNDNNNDLKDDSNGNNNDLNENELNMNNNSNFNTPVASVINLESEFNLINNNLFSGELLYSQPAAQTIPLTETILVRAFNIEIKIKDTDSLTTDNNSMKLLNDNIIDFYFNMIKNSKYNKNLANDINILSSFEFKRFIKNNDYIKKDKNRINIFNSDYVLIPICYSDHWSLVNIHVKTKKVRYFDSLISLTTNSDRKKLINEFVSKIIVHDSAKIDFSTELSDWKFRNESLIPQQTNKYDCGIFICLFAKIISYDLKILPSQFSDEYIIGYRLRMLDEIKKVELLDNDFIYASQFDKKKH